MPQTLSDWSKYTLVEAELKNTRLLAVEGETHSTQMTWDQGRPFEFLDPKTGKTVKRVLVPLIVDVDADCPLGCVIEANIEEGWVEQLVQEGALWVRKKTTGLRLKVVFSESTVP